MICKISNYIFFRNLILHLSFSRQFYFRNVFLGTACCSTTIDLYEIFSRTLWNKKYVSISQKIDFSTETSHWLVNMFNLSKFKKTCRTWLKNPSLSYNLTLSTCISLFSFWSARFFLVRVLKLWSFISL